MQFAPANATPKIAKEYVFANAENQAEWKKPVGNIGYQQIAGIQVKSAILDIN